MLKKLMLLVALAGVGVGCAAQEAEEGDKHETTIDATCEGATTELGKQSCMLGFPVAEGAAGGVQAPLGGTRIDLGDAVPEEQKAQRTYTGGCTGIWYGCSQVSAEGYFYQSCGTSHYVYMTFDGNYGNLVSWGVGYCWF